MTYNNLKKALIGALVFSASSAALAADEKKPLMTGANANMLANTCAGCHGTNGASAGPATPSISGISAVYFEEVMQGFKDDSVKNTIMGRIAKGYSDEEIKTMAELFSKQPFVQAKQSFDADKAAKGAKLHEKYCEKCHAEAGTSAENDSGILMGQLRPYLHYTMSDYKAGDREMTKKMKKKVNQLIKKEGDNGFDALFNFYAQGKQ
ncbi:MAG: cytochrome c4 [Candidatus Thiodiazotropha sp. (ex Lucinoma aequizonata)]|nr:cytochrome c4 [Candidatus Thiodiazotropha sp. (ex Lucinoma aequizonata)]MCU7889216.1 cytochrome c4 [Candidatus Thiodiazotropha sp. (ex Lucinoma aequizonata)]MCU7894053.1 cytochrome c4 [Candidatus Thiodiazotropha sp. (ex Lucinoma aequizonata)]MCU7899712.1 cytochrome c4 [Candidatus Thiodiazotropha sp. (ex Lucinoma aequizonata)]MCU7902802.1 cytochrome c4 [Candidatus Thiodiazotropha sp. (ex Lucinoma aequizonata)]